MRPSELKRRRNAPGYTPNRLLNRIMELLDIEHDLALAKALDLQASELSRIRQRRRYIGGDLLVYMHDLTGLSIEEMRELMGERCAK